MIKNNVQMIKDPGLNIVYYSVTDCDHVSHQVAREHVAGVLHIFGNLLDRLPDGVRNMLEGFQQEFLLKWKSAKDCYKGTTEHPPRISKEELDETKERLSDEYLAALCHVLSRTEFNHFAWCYKCECNCPTSPRQERAWRRGRWTDIGGHTCDPWTSQGAHNNFLDESTLPLLVWIFSAKYYEVDDLVDECTPLWKTELVDAILGDSDTRKALVQAGKISAEVADAITEDLIKILLGIANIMVSFFQF